MGLKDFKIIFDNPWSIYYTGQTMSGYILLVLDSTKKIRGISVKIKGEASTSWSNDDRETVTSYEKYFETKYYLVGSTSGSEIEIQPGEHKFPFSCALPPNLPSSFEHDLGHIRYTLKATLDRPWKFDQDVKAAFTVVSLFDLNKEPRALEPVRQEASKTFCCLCCASAPLTVNFSIPVRGYVPGQTIPIKLNVENTSNVLVDRIKLVLCKIVTFHGHNPKTETKTDEIVVTEISKGPIDAGATVDYEQCLEVPPLPPSNLNNCGIIDLEYNVKVEACVSEWYHRNLKASTLVFVGTVPLMNYQMPSAPPAEMVPDYPSKPTDDYPNNMPQLSPTSNLYPELPPPSYAESIYGAKNLQEQGESEHILGLMNPFAPRYPVYNFAPA